MVLMMVFSFPIRCGIFEYWSDIARKNTKCEFLCTGFSISINILSGLKLLACSTKMVGEKLACSKSIISNFASFIMVARILDFYCSCFILEQIPRDILLEVLGPSRVYKQVIKSVINSTVAEYVQKVKSFFPFKTLSYVSYTVMVCSLTSFEMVSIFGISENLQFSEFVF